MAAPQPRFGISRAKHALSDVEGTQRRQGDGARPVIPSECEGSKRISPFGRNDTERHFASWRLGARNIRVRGSSTPENFAQAAQISSYSNTKATKGSGFFDCKLRALRITIARNLRGLRKVHRSRKPSASDIPRAKTPRRKVQKSKFIFHRFFSYLGAFASLREIFRRSVAAEPRWAVVVKTVF